MTCSERTPYSLVATYALDFFQGLLIGHADWLFETLTGTPTFGALSRWNGQKRCWWRSTTTPR